MKIIQKKILIFIIGIIALVMGIFISSKMIDPQLAPYRNTCGPDISPNNVFACQSVNAPKASFDSLTVKTSSELGLTTSAQQASFDSLYVGTSSELGGNVILSGLSSSNFIPDSPEYICIQNDQLLRSPIPCSARESSICLEFDKTEVIKAIKASTDQEGVVFRERTPVYLDSYVAVPAGVLLKVKRIINSNGYANDIVEFENAVDPSRAWLATIMYEGSGFVDIEGQTYHLSYVNENNPLGNAYVILDYNPITGDNRLVDLSVCF